MEGTEERRKDMDKKAREEESRSGKRELEREEEKTVIKRRCVNLISIEAFEEFSLMDDSGSFEDSWEEVLSDSCGFLRRQVQWRCWGIWVFLVVAPVVALVVRPCVGLRSRLGCLVCLWCLFFRG